MWNHRVPHSRLSARQSWVWGGRDRWQVHVIMQATQWNTDPFSHDLNQEAARLEALTHYYHGVTTPLPVLTNCTPRCGSRGGGEGLGHPTPNLRPKFNFPRHHDSAALCLQNFALPPLSSYTNPGSAPDTPPPYSHDLNRETARLGGGTAPDTPPPYSHDLNRETARLGGGLHLTPLLPTVMISTGRLQGWGGGTISTPPNGSYYSIRHSPSLLAMYNPSTSRCGSRGGLGARAPPWPPILRPKFLPLPQLRCAMSAKSRSGPPLHKSWIRNWHRQPAPLVPVKDTSHTCILLEQ